MVVPRLSLFTILLVLTGAMLTSARSLQASPIAVAPLRTEGAATKSTGGSLAGREVVMIDAREFVVPKPWAGNKVAVPADTVTSLQMIPPELTLNQSEIHLRNEVIEPLKAMAAAAKKDKITLVVDSAYRSGRYQRQIFRQFLEKGQRFEHISRHIAPPGYSEHSLGTVVDFAPSSHGFAKTRAYTWLKKHAATYGFYETMPRDRRGSAPWEPWHWKFRLSPAQPKPAPTPVPLPEAEPPAEPAGAAVTEVADAAPPQRTSISISPNLSFDPLPLPR